MNAPDPKIDALVLAQLADAGGAVLSWQLGDDVACAFEDALDRGVIGFDADEDLYTHPAALREAPGAYSMPPGSF